jgi:hypothetical protein
LGRKREERWVIHTLYLALAVALLAVALLAVVLLAVALLAVIL